MAVFRKISLLGLYTNDLVQFAHAIEYIQSVHIQILEAATKRLIDIT